MYLTKMVYYKRIIIICALGGVFMISNMAYGMYFCFSRETCYIISVYKITIINTPW